MSADALYGELRRRGVELVLEGNRLRYLAPGGALDDALRRDMAHHKTELMDLLRAQPGGLTTWPWAPSVASAPESAARPAGSRARPSAAWVIRPRPEPDARLRLICLPPAGGGALAYRSWVGRAGDGVEVCPVQLPGRETRLGEPCFTQVRPLVHGLAAALEPWLDRPYVMFGHSMGALLAFELARHFRRSGLPLPEKLVVSGRNAPSRPWGLPPLSRLSDTALLLWLRRLGGTPDDVLDDPDLMRALLPSLRADLSVCESYGYSEEPPLPCAIDAFGGQQDPHTSEDGLAAWRGESEAAFRLRLFPGHHFFFRTAEPEVLDALSGVLGPCGAEERKGAEP